MPQNTMARRPRAVARAAVSSSSVMRSSAPAATNSWRAVGGGRVEAGGFDAGRVVAAQRCRPRACRRFRRCCRHQHHVRGPRLGAQGGQQGGDFGGEAAVEQGVGFVLWEEEGRGKEG